ncbi:MAG: FecR family protein [Phycisphaeraceae bacterium]
MTPDDSKVSRLLALVVESELGEADERCAAELEGLLRSSEAMRLLYLDVLQLTGLIGEAACRAEGDDAGAWGDVDQADRAVLAEILEEALRSRRLAEISERADAALLADRAARRQRDRLARRDPAQRTPGRIIVVPRGLAYGLVAASLLVVAALVYTHLPGPGPTPVVEQGPPTQTPPPDAPAGPVYATVLARHGDRWASSADADRYTLSAGGHELLDGFVSLRLKDGAEVLIQGPARFSVLGPNSLSLETGKLYAEVSRQAIGFTVDTPTARIVDIGTAFGVTADPAGSGTHLQVYRGEVRAAARRNGEAADGFVSLLEREAFAFSSDAPPTKADFDEGLYERDMYRVMLRPTMGEQAQWLDELPRDLRRNASTSDRLQVFLERNDVLLEEPLTVDFNRYESWPRSGVGNNRVAAGTRVDVYYLHLDGTDAEQVDVKAAIDFGRPILGVVAAGRTLWATDGLLANPGTVYPQLDGASEYEINARGIDFFNDDDVARIERDGQTLYVDLGAVHHVDQMRVIVEAAPRRPGAQP